MEHSVDLIVDIRTAGGPPQGVASAYRFADRKVPPNQALIGLVKASAYMKAFFKVASDIAPRASQDRFSV